MKTEKNIFDMFVNLEYPDSEDLVSGLKDGVMYCYVSSTYLNGYINYVDIITSYMVRHYMNENEWASSCELIDNGFDCHTNMSNADKYDDVLIFSKSGDFYVIFWSDRDCSDCCIGKIHKSKFNSENDAISSFKHGVMSLFLFNMRDAEKDVWGKYIKEIPSSFFKGWITI